MAERRWGKPSRQEGGEEGLIPGRSSLLGEVECHAAGGQSLALESQEWTGEEPGSSGVEDEGVWETRGGPSSVLSWSAPAQVIPGTGAPKSLAHWTVP